MGLEKTPLHNKSINQIYCEPSHRVERNSRILAPNSALTS